jgi:hypothetical protein
MKKHLLVVAACLTVVVPAFAHRLDEYLQAILVSVEQGRIHASMRLIPGVAVSTAVLAGIDVNADGVLSAFEQQTYAQEVLRDLSISVDGHTVKPRLESVSFPAPTEMREGTGEIHIDFSAESPDGGSRRTLVIENHHKARMSVYLMNCLVPQDREIQIIGRPGIKISRSIESSTCNRALKDVR